MIVYCACTITFSSRSVRNPVNGTLPFRISSVPLHECPRLKSSLTDTLTMTQMHLLRLTAAAPLLKSRNMVCNSPDSLPITKSDLRHDNDNTASLCAIPQMTVAVACSAVLKSPPVSSIALLACMRLREVDKFITTSSGSVESSTVVSPSVSYYDDLY